jgi:polyisoprenoid-binding protein YceI
MAHLNNTNDSYGIIAHALHWLVAALVLVQFGLGMLSSRRPQGQRVLRGKAAGRALPWEFRRFGGEACLSEGRATRIDVWLDPPTAESGLPEIEAALNDTDFFAADRYSRIVYTSLSVEERGNTQLAHCIVEIKGKRHDLDIPFSLQREGGNPMVSGTLTLNRLEYGIGTGEWSNTKWLSGDVNVQFQAMLIAK